MANTKIICTIGTATATHTKIKQLIQAGMTAARINFSHGTHAENLALIQAVRAVALECKTYIPIILDLQGPRIRLGLLPKEGVLLKKGEHIALLGRGVYKMQGGVKCVPVDDPHLHEIVRPDDVILIEDGTIELQVSRVSDTVIYASAKDNALLLSHKGINIPGTVYKKNVLTKKDIDDLKFGLKHNIDFIALSFVRSHHDVQRLKKLVKKHTPARIIAKIERPEALKDIDRIIKSADAIMVARGDLALETPEYGVPVIKKQLTQKALKAAKPVIVATQMLDSMIRNKRPTRAEVSDVASAVIDHADCLMLSGETASGKYPIEACAMMQRIIAEMEKSPYDDLSLLHISKKPSLETAVGHAAAILAKEAEARAILIVSPNGHAVRMIARFRPQVHIIAATTDERQKRDIALSWGIRLFDAKNIPRHEIIKKAIAHIHNLKLAKKGEKIIIVSDVGKLFKKELALYVHPMV